MLSIYWLRVLEQSRITFSVRRRVHSFWNCSGEMNTFSKDWKISWYFDDDGDEECCLRQWSPVGVQTSWDLANVKSKAYDLQHCHIHQIIQWAFVPCGALIKIVILYHNKWTQILPEKCLMSHNRTGVVFHTSSFNLSPICMLLFNKTNNLACPLPTTHQ